MSSSAGPFSSVERTQEALAASGYLADRSLAVVTWLALTMDRPLLLEGPPGVGKTELAKTVAAADQRPLIRLQCYEGLEESKALYEWEYGKQLMYTQLVRDALKDVVRDAPDLSEAVSRVAEHEDAFFHERFLLERPILRALRSEVPTVLLIDEVDRSDPELEAMLLEVLGERSVSIPELGTFHARSRPFVVLTSNATRELTEALRRRCLHFALELPDEARELAIVRQKVPKASETLTRSLVSFVQSLRELPLKKLPSIGETLDWARALVLIGASDLDEQTVRSTLGLILKHRADVELVSAQLGRRLVGSKT